MNGSLGWFGSPDGTAAATWVSAILSLAAILIALGVALIEQRRANAERITEQRKEQDDLARRDAIEKKRRANFVDSCCSMISDARSTFEAEAELVRSISFVDWLPDAGASRMARIFLTSLRALQNSWRGDHNITLALSSAIIALEEIELARGLGGAPPGSRVADLLELQSEALAQVQAKLQQLR